ncbi:hypothetical protein S7711_08524 [Stachybotrys chartarum IBT 7711]|uniref:alpha-1,2-Mannosidase n=1 Tax=Stachybotrys chartarum (strain CBS 109288 / IBT 7711) TaxID=1280523 RepID=A0A084AZU5_STACB|nr:hypothetical protein S7711_08524 [Stachybotrys chartarum IBT 7711]KFA51374.1 hypothetical protein S40293_03252 [Stachybotrys chartarum IBT 40293]KFA79204.1 hypothetical protein S40288_02343 [Stachybotrys chartarum IBT 40288]
MAIRLARRAPRVFIGIAAILFLYLHLRHAPSAPALVSLKHSTNAYDWSTFVPYNPVLDIKPLPTVRPRSLPRVQAEDAAFKASPVNQERRNVVRGVFERSYRAYRKYAWLRDELTPVTGRGKDPFGGWAATLVDSLDTLWIMGFRREFHEALGYVDRLDVSDSPAGAINIFETTIRHLGGLLSAYDLSGEEVLLRKAVELADLLYVGFDTPNRLPGFWLNFADAREGLQWAGRNDPSACPASLCLEFTRLSQITGNSKYYDATDRVMRFLERVQNATTLPGMWPTTIDFRNEEVPGTSYTLGALADSLYEYLPKMHALLGGVDSTYETMYRKAAKRIIEYMVFRPMLPEDAPDRDILFTGDLHIRGGQVVERVTESQHLTCFVGGMFGLAGKLLQLDDQVTLGEQLARGCGWAYASMPTGIMPEIFDLVACDAIDGPCPWDQEKWENETASTSLPKGFRNARDTRYILRPEAIESVFLLYRMTGKAELQDLAWDMFQAVVRATETGYAYSAIADVTQKGETKKLDSMESFWMAETLKYYYLIFSPPDLISLDEYVLNTEAHPFLRPKAYEGA